MDPHSQVPGAKHLAGRAHSRDRRTIPDLPGCRMHSAEQAILCLLEAVDDDSLNNARIGAA